MENSEYLNEDASDGELAAYGLVMELLGTAGILTLLAETEIQGADGGGPVDEQTVAAVTRRCVELIVPALAVYGVKPCLWTTELLQTVRECILDDARERFAGWDAVDPARLN